MKVHKDCRVESHIPLEELADEIEKRLANGWTRAHDSEKDPVLGVGSMRYFVFESPSRPPVHHARLFFLRRPGGVMDIVNICPAEDAPNPLGHDNYNAIMDDLIQMTLQPLEAEGKIKLSVGSPTLSVEKLIGSTLFQKLQGFSRSTNRSTGSSHPSDRRQWVDFLCAAHDVSPEFNSDVLRRWLVEEEGWPHDAAVDLAIEFEFANDLLDYYKRG